MDRVSDLLRRKPLPALDLEEREEAVVPQRFKKWTMPTRLLKRMVDRVIGRQFGLMKKAV